MLDGKRDQGFNDKKRGGRPKVLNKAPINCFQSRAGSWKAKFGDPWDGKKASTPPAKQRSAHLKFV